MVHFIFSLYYERERGERESEGERGRDRERQGEIYSSLQYQYIIIILSHVSFTYILLYNSDSARVSSWINNEEGL